MCQPTGTVTMVFTDIEGSTRLLQELGGEAYREVLAEHRRVVREGCAGLGGYEVDCEGDSFFNAFASASGAVAAVEQVMRAPWRADRCGFVLVPTHSVRSRGGWRLIYRGRDTTGWLVSWFAVALVAAVVVSVVYVAAALLLIVAGAVA